MGQPPGIETLANPWRASMGPSSRIDARVVWVVCRETNGERSCGMAMRMLWPLISPSAPISRRAANMTLMSSTSGTLLNSIASGLRQTAASSGSAAFLAPEMATRPANGRPPWMEMMIFCIL